jgi:hypothetical protein
MPAAASCLPCAAASSAAAAASLAAASRRACRAAASARAASASAASLRTTPHAEHDLAKSQLVQRNKRQAASDNTRARPATPHTLN